MMRLKYGGSDLSSKEKRFVLKCFPMIVVYIHIAVFIIIQLVSVDYKKYNENTLGRLFYTGGIMQVTKK